MPNVYKAIQNSQPVPPSDANAACPGHSVMKLLIFSGTDVDALFDAFSAFFRKDAAWTWTGAAVTPAAGAILDGDANAKTGQCVALARAFRRLAISPPPHGLGLPEGAFGDPGATGGGKYSGRYNKGFISTHRDVNGGNAVLGLGSNMLAVPANPDLYDPTVVPRPQLYSWGDHKTVPYKGKYYDPSYWTVYDQLEDMVLYHMVQDDEHAVARQLQTNEGGTRTCQFVAAESAARAPCFFRIIEPNEAPNMAYQGPYAALPGAAA